MEKLLLFVDYANINAGAQNLGIDMDYYDFMNYISDGRFLIDSYIYVPIDPRNEHKRDKLIENLWLNGYLVNKKTGTIAGNSYKCDFDVEITMDITNAIHQVKPDIVVLASGDSDFIPLVVELRKHGIRVEVASFQNGASRDMIMKASGFINLDLYFEEKEDDGYMLDDKQKMINEYDEYEEENDNEMKEENNKNNYDSELETLSEITAKNEAKKQNEDKQIKIIKQFEENINKPLIEEFEEFEEKEELNVKTEDIKGINILEENENKNKKLEEVDIDIDIEKFKDPWNWE